MRHTIIDFVASVATDRRRTLDRELAALAASIPTPSGGPLGAIGSLHFASLTVFDDEGFAPTLVVECNFDDTLDAFLPALLAVAAGPLHAILGCCVDYLVTHPADVDGMESYLRTHMVRPAAAHIGAVGRSCDRIQRESDLHRDLSHQIDEWQRQRALPAAAEQVYALLVHALKVTGRRWVFDSYETQTNGEKLLPVLRVVGTVAPVLAALGAVYLVGAQIAGASTWRAIAFTVAAIAILLGVVAVVLRRSEERDDPMNPAATSQAHFAKLGALEDHYRLNHLGSMTIVKDGLFRRTLLRVVLHVAKLGAGFSTHGSLSGIPTIHFAHWTVLDGGRRLLFLSNYDGSWGSYLDDFVDKASVGLTGIWSNTRLFPHTRWLVKNGARDGAAFKAFARMHQTPTAVWYLAAPYRNEGLTVGRINANTDLRVGLASGAGAFDLPHWTRQW